VKSCFVFKTFYSYVSTVHSKITSSLLHCSDTQKSESKRKCFFHDFSSYIFFLHAELHFCLNLIVFLGRVDNLPGLDQRPLVPLQVHRQRGQHAQQNARLKKEKKIESWNLKELGHSVDKSTYTNWHLKEYTVQTFIKHRVWSKFIPNSEVDIICEIFKLAVFCSTLRPITSLTTHHYESNLNLKLIYLLKNIIMSAIFQLKVWTES